MTNKSIGHRKLGPMLSYYVVIANSVQLVVNPFKTLFRNIVSKFFA